MLQFTVFHNNELIKTYEFDTNTITIGRLPENDIPIASISISRRHVRIQEEISHQFVLTDLNSLNGTFMNNKKVIKTNIFSDDKITIGKYTVVFHILPETNTVPETNYKEDVEDDNEIVDLESLKKNNPSDQDDGLVRSPEKETIPQKESLPNGQPPNASLIETNKHVVYKIDKETMSIGSSETDDVFVEGFLITDEHVFIEKKIDGTYIHANKLMGRFKINGKKESKHKLQHKDRIEIGTSTFRYMENGPQQ